MTGPVAVTQADREGWQEMKPIAEMVQAEFDAAIARARIEGARIALEAAAKVFEAEADTWVQTPLRGAMKRKGATAIRQIDPAQIVKGQSDAE